LTVVLKLVRAEGEAGKARDMGDIDIDWHALGSVGSSSLPILRTNRARRLAGGTQEGGG
jgi:hypothetical protein